MKPISIFILLIFLFPARLIARDYMVEMFEEKYKEKMIVGEGDLKIYHTWQIKTKYGNKILILVGEDESYRKWLRRYSRSHKLFVVKIPDDGDAGFEYDIGVLVDVQQIHPVSSDKWRCKDCRHGPPAPKPKIQPQPQPQ